MHLLKNGHAAHVFTIEERRKAAAVTNDIRRAKRARFEQVRSDQEMEQMLARTQPGGGAGREAAAPPRRAEARYWIERGYGARS
jgi:hypothetical protein